MYYSYTTDQQILRLKQFLIFVELSTFNQYGETAEIDGSYNET